MNDIVFYALLATLGTWLVTALGAATVVLFKSPNPKILNLMLGFAAGVMVAASFWSLLQPAIERAEAAGSMPAFLVATLGFLCGALFMWGSDKCVTYAQRRWNPSMIVDVATLTGACVVALGDDVAGLFCQDATLAQRIKDFGDIVGEPYWPLPLWDRYFELLKSETADFANAGARAGGASSAAVFLKQFITFDGSWAHLDIAGPGFVTRKVPNCRAGGTGFAVRTLIELAENK